MTSRRQSEKSFDQLKKECLVQNVLFEDPDFPAVDASAYFSMEPPKKITWLRPKEISKNAQFIWKGMERFDIMQGELGNCWLLAAVACLSLYPNLMERVVPPDQSMEKEYAGIFRFNFWRFGTWIEVVVDDRLPTNRGRLLFEHASSGKEFWSSLLEKAYAKMCGSYEALQGGITSEALVDFTGGISHTVKLGQDTPEDFPRIILQAVERGSLMSCAIDPIDGQIVARLPNGLFAGHAYSITDIKKIGQNLLLVRMRNPWGQKEWQGAYSDESPEWDNIPPRVRKDLGLVVKDDGEFWMSYSNFVGAFQHLEMCHVSKSALSDGMAEKKWEETILQGSWQKNISAGGCHTFSMNPQYIVEVVDPDTTDNDNSGTLIVSLTQKSVKRRFAEGYVLIGYVVYDISGSKSRRLDSEFFRRNRIVARSDFTNTRDVCTRHKLPVGHYVVIPSTFEPGLERDFMIRIISEKPLKSRVLDERTSIKSDKKKTSVVETNSDRSMFEAFRMVAGEDMVIRANEFENLLNSVFKKDEFRFLTSLYRQRNASGTLEYEEFKQLWIELKTWKMVFKSHDKNRNDRLHSHELIEALKELGFTFSFNTLSLLIKRYGNSDGNIYFDDFIHLVAKLTAMSGIYQQMSADNGGRSAKFTVDAFLQTTMLA